MNLFGTIKIEGHMKEILSGALSAMVIKIISAGVAFLFNVLIARLLGVEDVGVYFLALTIALIGSTLGRVGFDNVMLRYISSYTSTDDWSLALGVYKGCIQIIAFTSSLITIALVSTSTWIADVVFSSPELADPLSWMALTILPISLFTLYAQALQGLKRIRVSIAVQSLWVPLFSSLGVIVLVPSYGVIGAIYAYIIAVVINMVIAHVNWSTAVSTYNDTPVIDYHKIVNTAYPLFVSSIMRLIIERSALIIIGAWAVSSDVGIFGVASRMALLISFILVAVNSISAPKFSALYHQGRVEELAYVARKTSFLLTLIAVPVFIVYVFFADFLMAIFGSEFVAGSNILIILSLGQVFNVLTGSVGYLLTMTGNEAVMRNNLIFCAVINLILCLTLIPVYGVTGAAVAVTFTVIMQNTIATILVWKCLGFIVFPVPVKKILDVMRDW